MKIKDLPMIIVTAAIMAMIFIPLPPVMVIICTALYFAYGLTIFGIGIHAAFKKAYPKFLPQLLLYFSFFALAIYIATTRSLLTWAPGEADIVIISKMANEVINPPIVGYLIAIVGIFFLLGAYPITGNTDDGNLEGSIKFIKGTQKAIILIFLASVIGSFLIGYLKFKLSIIDSINTFLPNCCAEIIVYIIPIMLVDTGISFKSVKEKKK